MDPSQLLNQHGPRQQEWETFMCSHMSLSSLPLEIDTSVMRTKWRPLPFRNSPPAPYDVQVYTTSRFQNKEAVRAELLRAHPHICCLPVQNPTPEDIVVDDRTCIMIMDDADLNATSKEDLFAQYVTVIAKYEVVWLICQATTRTTSWPLVVKLSKLARSLDTKLVVRWLSCTSATVKLIAIAIALTVPQHLVVQRHWMTSQQSEVRSSPALKETITSLLIYNLLN
jgi:hypothetical protein